MCVNVLFVMYCVFVCACKFRFVFDVLCDVLWLVFVLCFCGWVLLFNMFVCFVPNLLFESVSYDCVCCCLMCLCSLFASGCVMVYVLLLC